VRKKTKKNKKEIKIETTACPVLLGGHKKERRRKKKQQRQNIIASPYYVWAAITS